MPGKSLGSSCAVDAVRRGWLPTAPRARTRHGLDTQVSLGAIRNAGARPTLPLPSPQVRGLFVSPPGVPGFTT